VPQLDRIVLRDNLATREFSDQSQVLKTTLTTRVLQLVHEICMKGIHVTKRDLFYTDVKLFEVRLPLGTLD
jgi:meiotic recombination protein SPO11